MIGYISEIGAPHPDGDGLTFTLLSTPADGMSLDPKTGLLRWLPAKLSDWLLRQRMRGLAKSK